MAHQVRVARWDQLKPTTGLTIELAGRAIALFLHEGEPYAIDEHCPHAGGSLGSGYVQDGCVMCPWHGWRFRVTDGVWADAPQTGTKVRTYNVERRGDDVYLTVDWEPPA